MGTKEQKDLLEHIDLQHVECLNEDSNKPFDNVLKQGYREDAGLHLESDTDEQILLNIPFLQVVKLHSMVIQGLDPEKAPKVVKMFSNRPSLGFSDAADEVAQQEFEFTEEEISSGKPIQLKFVKFQHVRNISIFVESNQGDEETTVINKIQLIGSTVETTNMKELKKVG
eukprot:CAMPEP_0196586012 /NCGR_PEP_ID=MMETSP1081-20130531/52852_1 /TAXON_ID=36882 /ORGANISM="Pyramimonas amylifera, Strain CCMP720" /LENGTH=169 /DNA_ID=CAMNT_0041907745 /DNA_START=50 /DNA_END=559 /DNA_ORIENTATION=-